MQDSWSIARCRALHRPWRTLAIHPLHSYQKPGHCNFLLHREQHASQALPWDHCRLDKGNRNTWQHESPYILQHHLNRPPGSFKFCLPLSACLCLIHVGYKVVAQVKAWARHHSANLEATMGKNSGCRWLARVVKNWIGSVESSANTFFFSIVVDTQGKAVDQKSTINRQILLNGLWVMDFDQMIF